MKTRTRIFSALLALLLVASLLPVQELHLVLPASAEEDYTDLTIDLKHEDEYTGMTPAQILTDMGKKDAGSYTGPGVANEQVYKDAANNPDLWRHAWKWTVNEDKEGSIRKYLTSTDPKDTYICLTGDDTSEYHTKAEAWETMVITTDKVLDLNGHVMKIQLNNNRNNAKYDRYQNKSAYTHNNIAFEITNGATLTIIDSSAWRGENYGKGKGEISFTGYMVSPFHYDIDWYTTRDLFKVTNGNLVIYGGTFQAGRKKYQSKDVSIDDFETIVGQAVSLGVAIAEYATGCNTEVAKYQDILEAAKDAAGTVSGPKETPKNESDSDQASGPNTVKEKDGSGAPKEKKEDTAKEAGQDGTSAGRNQTVQEKKDDKNKAIAEGTKNATPEGSSTGNNGQASTAKNDKNAKLAEAENNVVKAFLDENKLKTMVKDAFGLAKGIKGLFTNDGSARVCQSIKGTVVTIGNDGTFVCYGGTFNGYGSTPDTRNAVIECTRLSTVNVNDKTKYQGGLAYIYGGTFNAYNGANVFNMVKANNGKQIVYRVTEDEKGNQTVTQKTLTDQETGKLEILYYENQENILKPGFAFTPINTSNVQVRGGTFRCYYDLWNVATKDGSDEHFTKFPGTSGSVNLGPESFGNDLIQDGRIQLIDTYGDGALVLLDERTEEAAAVQNAGLYHYRLFCSSTELRAKNYLQVMPNEAVTNASASMQLATYQDNEKAANKLWLNDEKKENIRTPMTQTERYFEFMYNDSDAANYAVMPNFHDTQSGKYDVYGKHLDDSEIWYYPTPKDAKNNPIEDVSLTDLRLQAVSKKGSSIYLSQRFNDENTWNTNLKNVDPNSIQLYSLNVQSAVRENMRHFTYKMYRVDPLTRENLSESNVYGVDEPLFEVTYGTSPGSLKCKFPLLEVQEQLKQLRPDWPGYQSGEYYRIVLDIEEHMGIGFNGSTYGAKMPVAHTTSTILFRCTDVNETQDNGGAYKDHDFTALQWVDTPKAGSTASVQIVNGKAGMTDYAALNKIFDVYYQWWEVDATGEPVTLLAGTDNIYDPASGVDKSDHKPSMWNVGKDGKHYFNTVDPSDPKASTYATGTYVNGLPANPLSWTPEQLHMYSAQVVERMDLTKDSSKTLSLMNNNVFKTNTDSCYIPEELAGKDICVKAIVINYTRPGTNVYDKKQTFTSHAFRVAEKDSGETTMNKIEAVYSAGKEYATATDPVTIKYKDDTTVLYTILDSLSFKATSCVTGETYTKKFSDLHYTSRDQLPQLKFPTDFKDVLDPNEIPTGEYKLYIRYGTRWTLSGNTYVLYNNTNTVSFDYEAPATGMRLTQGSVVEYSLTDVQNGVYAAGERLIAPVPANASAGFDYNSATTTNFSVAFMGADGLIRFGGAAGTTTIALRGPDGKIVSVTVKVTKEAGDQSPVQNTNLGENTFVDVQETAFYGDPVLWAVGHDPQITNGMDPTHFAPGATCTRGQIVTFLWRAKGCPEPETTVSPFVDVTGGYYFKPVLWAVEAGITNGIDATHFGPNNGCTRGQVVTFIWRAMDEPAPKSTTTAFVDLLPSAYYYNAVLWAVENGVTNGIDPTHFAPNNVCQRGQIVTFLFRADTGGNLLRFTEQPIGGLIDSANGTTFPLSVKVTGGTAPYTYQWHRVRTTSISQAGGGKQRFQSSDDLRDTSLDNIVFDYDEPIEDAVMPDVTVSQEGWYECVVNDAAGRSIRSVRVHVADKLSFFYESPDGYCSTEMPCYLRADVAGGMEPLSCQWYKDGQSFGEPNKVGIYTNEAGSYFCEVKDSFGQRVRSRTFKVESVGASGVNVLGQDDFLFYAEDVVYVTGRGLVVSGRVVNGRVDTGDTIRLLSYDPDTKQSVVKEFTVDGIEMFHKVMDYAEKGDNAGLLLKEAVRGDVQTGDALVGQNTGLKNLTQGARLVGKIELNDLRNNPFQVGDTVQLKVPRGTDVTGLFLDLNGDPIGKNTTRDNVVMRLANSAHRPICFYPGQQLNIQVGGRIYGTFTIVDIREG